VCRWQSNSSSAPGIEVGNSYVFDFEVDAEFPSVVVVEKWCGVVCWSVRQRSINSKSVDACPRAQAFIPHVSARLWLGAARLRPLFPLALVATLAQQQQTASHDQRSDWRLLRPTTTRNNSLFVRYSIRVRLLLSRRDRIFAASKPASQHIMLGSSRAIH
jgi:hypothetical protein